MEKRYLAGLITRRSVVQVHPPQMNIIIHISLLSLFGISLAGRASDSESEGPRFEPWIPSISAKQKIKRLKHATHAWVVELADTHGLEPCAARREGSTPSSGTNFVAFHLNYFESLL